MESYKLEYVKCEICKNDSTRVIYNERGFNIVQCIHCGLVYVNPRLSEDEYKGKANLNYENLVKESLIIQGYKEIDDKILNKTGVNKSRYIASRFKQTSGDLRCIERIYKSKGNLLDVGCGEGFFSKEALDNGWQVCGVEMSKKHRPSPEYGLNVINEDILTAELPKNYFDVVTMWDVLEHMLHPDKVIKKIEGVLKNNGLLVIRVPNVRYLRLKHKLVSIIFDKDFYLKNKNFSIMGFYAPETHFYNFSENTLGKLLNKNNFRIIKIKLGKFAIGPTRLRTLIHNILFNLSKIIYFLSAGKLNYNCSIIIFARKIN